MKSLTLIAGSENTARVLSAQLSEYFGGKVGLQTLWMSGGPVEAVSSPVVVLSSSLVGEEVARSGLIPGDARVIVGRRIVDCDGLERVVSLPPGTKALFVNDRPETARDCVESLVSLGMDGIDWLPWHPGSPTPPSDYRIAVVAGESALVPPGIPTVIDIGVRIFDFASLTEILSSVGLEDGDSDRFPKRYLSRIVNLAGRLAKSIEESRRLNEHLGSVIDSLRHGIIVYDRDGWISVCNEELRSILNLRAGVGRGETLAKTIRSQELLAFLEGGGAEESGVFRLPEGNINVFLDLSQRSPPGFVR